MSWLPAILIGLGGASLIAVAQTLVREKSADAAQKLSIAGGLVVAGPVLRLVPVGQLVMAGPLISVAALGLAVWALFILVDEVNPRQQGVRLPPSIEALRGSGPGSGIGPRILYAVFAVMAVVASARYSETGGVAASALAVVIAILGGHLLNQRGSPAVWVLDRHPEWVVWVYPSQLTVINRRYGTRSVYWRAIVGLGNGERLMLPAGSDRGAGQLAAEVAAVCPKASVGHTGELEAKFRMSPEALRRP